MNQRLLVRVVHGKEELLFEDQSLIASNESAALFYSQLLEKIHEQKKKLNQFLTQQISTANQSIPEPAEESEDSE